MRPLPVTVVSIMTIFLYRHRTQKYRHDRHHRHASEVAGVNLTTRPVCERALITNSIFPYICCRFRHTGTHRIPIPNAHNSNAISHPAILLLSPVFGLIVVGSDVPGSGVLGAGVLGAGVLGVDVPGIGVPEIDVPGVDVPGVTGFCVHTAYSVVLAVMVNVCPGV